MIRVQAPGDFSKTQKALLKMKSGDIYRHLDRAGRNGVDALSRASPWDTGRMAGSWGYQVGHTGSVYSISWFNTDNEGGVNVAIILQYGHGTGTGGYVRGIDYINPAIKPVFDHIAQDVWRQVTNA